MCWDETPEPRAKLARDYPPLVQSFLEAAHRAAGLLPPRGQRPEG
jgi:hypothetical protein